MKPAYAKASAFAICYRRRALRYGGQDGGQVGSANWKLMLREIGVCRQRIADAVKSLKEQGVFFDRFFIAEP